MEHSRYSFNIPSFSLGKNVQFYFSFKDSANIDYRVPLTDNFQFSYGDLNISLNLASNNLLNNDLVSDPFPNPFLPAEHQGVRVNFISSGNELFKMAIIDGAGQKVKSFSLISTIGM